MEISPEQEQDAEILRDELRNYRATMGVPFRYPSRPDRILLAQILEIAPIEDLCGVLRRLLDDGVRPGTEDAWFVTTLLDKIHDVPPATVAARRKALKSKKPPMNENLLDFGPELVRSTAAGMKNF